MLIIYIPNRISVQRIQPRPTNPKRTVILTLTLFASECPPIPLAENNKEEQELDDFQMGKCHFIKITGNSKHLLQNVPSNQAPSITQICNN